MFGGEAVLPAERCNTALGACARYVDALTAEEDALKAKLGIVTQQRDAAEKLASKAEDSPLMPFWAWMLTGLIVGGIVVHEVGH